MPSALLRTLQSWLPRRIRPAPELPDPLWQATVQQLPFLADLSSQDLRQLRTLCGQFLQEKEFHGAHGLVVTDDMALYIAAQACLPLLHIVGPNGEALGAPLKALDWYADFVGIVVQPGAALALRERTDQAGVVHRYQEALAGEAMAGGPIMLSWASVSDAPQMALSGGNIVIHEFAHKLDMHSKSAGQAPDGAPPLFKGFMGLPSDKQARTRWQTVMQTEYDRFREAVALAERFGGEQPWLDSYAAQHPAEFFAVTSEAYFVRRERFAQAFPALLELYDGFYRFRARSALE